MLELQLLSVVRKYRKFLTLHNDDCCICFPPPLRLLLGFSRTCAGPPLAMTVALVLRLLVILLLLLHFAMLLQLVQLQALLLLPLLVHLSMLLFVLQAAAPLYDVTASLLLRSLAAQLVLLVLLLVLLLALLVVSVVLRSRPTTVPVLTYPSRSGSRCK